MSEEVEVEDVQVDIKELKQENRNYRKKASEYKAQYEDLQKTFTAVQEELGRLKGEYLTTKHKNALTKVGADLGVPSEALEGLWLLSGHKAEGEVDEEIMKGVVSKTLMAHPYLKGVVATKPGPGFVKGPTIDASKRQVKRDDLFNPSWQAENKDIFKAYLNGEVQILD